MFIELVDQLRCPRAHEPTWLVASIDRAHDRDIVEGTLGCPSCATRYPVHRGILDLRTPGTRQAASDRTPKVGVGSDEDALRLAAYLDLIEPGGFVVLTGDWAVNAVALTRLTDGVHALVVNSASDLSGIAGVSPILAVDGIPVRSAASRGVALDARHATPAHVADAITSLRGGGRLVAPASVPVTPELTLLARDERYWVAERSTTVSAPVSLTRAERS